MTNCQHKCFLSLCIEALAIKKKFKLYKLEKERAKAGKDNTSKCICTQISGYCSSLCHSNQEYRKCGFLGRFLVEDTLENYILKSVLGFIGGVLLTYICFMFLVFSLNFTLKRATYICIGLGIVLSVGLAFSVKIRCTVFLCIPQLFSKRGRQALLAYAFILALSGPAKNTLHNVEVMSESLACGQEQLKQAENELLKCVQKPNAAAKKLIEKLLEKINDAVKYFKNFILNFYRDCFDILETVHQAQKWLYSISLLCQKKIRHPTQRCTKLLVEASQNCENIHHNKFWANTCQIEPFIKRYICGAKAKTLCLKSDIPELLEIPLLKKKLNTIKHRAMNTLFVKVEVHQTYAQSNRTTTYHEEYQGVATEIRQKTDQFLQYFDFMSVIFGIFILVLFIKVIIYRHRFLTQDHYDNRFITSDFIDIDAARAQFNMQTVLPLEPREKMRYIKVTSMRLVSCERVKLFSSFVFLIFATFKIIIHMLTDSSLYWILSSVRRDERYLYMNSLKEEEPSVSVRIEGEGVVAALLRNVSRAIKRQSVPPRIDPTPCLPDPIPPDWNRYYQIYVSPSITAAIETSGNRTKCATRNIIKAIALVLICWFLALCEPYGLRLRHSVMVTYHPDRARERAIWLYNRIISNRTSFIKTVRREIRRRYRNAPSDTLFGFQFIRRKTVPKCLLCDITITCTEDGTKCTTRNCVGMYCSSCFATLKCCPVCCDPVEYGDYSDISEEKDSSEEEIDYKKSNRQKQVCLKSPKESLETSKTEKQNTTKQPRRVMLRDTLLTFPRDWEGTALKSRKPKKLSDIESSDWETGTLLKKSKKMKNSEARSTKSENKMKKTKEDKTSGEGGKKSKSKKSKRKDLLLESLSPAEKMSVKIFKKLSGKSVDQSRGGWDQNEHSRKEQPIKIKGKKAPDLRFRSAKADPSLNKKVSSFMTAKDSLDKFKQEIKNSNKRHSRYCLSPEEKTPSKDSIQEPSLDKKISFVDPFTICPRVPSPGPALNFQAESENEKTIASEELRIIPIDPTASDKEKDFKCNTQSRNKKETASSSAETESQYYSQTYSPQKILGNSKIALRKVSARMNVLSKRDKLYLVETDSSNEKYMSVKAARKGRKSQKKSKSKGDESDVVNTIPNYSRKKNKRSSEFLRAKLTRRYRKNLSERKSSDQDSSDIDNEEYMQNTTIFISDEEFEKISRKMSEKMFTQESTAMNFWAPDLLSNLPSPK